ncbi:SERTA domain-containing protein 3 [Paramarasmius palmivorus]|uniref:SERTA domain-containing protein 3 n=1 Tax=Paramarasmius palmivorus TaxID=297713 RepID=A0AAW0B808_9AGAR
MVNPGAFTGSRLTFLHSHIEAYGVAVQEGWVKDFVADLARRYHKRYPASLEHNKEPTEEHLASVNDDAPDPETMFPIRKANQSEEAFQEVVREHENLKSITNYRVAQIARWMKYHYDKSRGIKSKDNPFSKLMNRLTGSSVEEPKRKARTYDLWAKGHPERVDELVATRMEELRLMAEDVVDADETAVVDGEMSKGADGGSDLSEDDKEPEKGEEDSGSQSDKAEKGKKPKKAKRGKKKGKFVKKGKKAFVRVRQEVIKKEYDSLSPEDKKSWEDAVQEDWDKRVAEHKASLDRGFSTEPQARQDCIARLPSFIQPILNGITEATGMHCTLVVGGPEPADMGRLNVVSFHSGETLSNPAMNFGEACQEGYRNLLIPLYGSYLRKCFTIEECKSRALPKSALSLEGVLMGELGVNFDALDTPGIPRDEQPSGTSAVSTGPGSQKEAVDSQKGSQKRTTPSTQTQSTVVNSTNSTGDKPEQAASRNPPAARDSSTSSQPPPTTANPPESGTPKVSTQPLPSPGQVSSNFSPPPSPILSSASSPPPGSPPTTIPPSTPQLASSPLYPPSPDGSIATADLDIPPIDLEEPDQDACNPEPARPSRKRANPDSEELTNGRSSGGNKRPRRSTTGSTTVAEKAVASGTTRKQETSSSTRAAVRSQRPQTKEKPIPVIPIQTKPKVPTTASPNAASQPSGRSKRKATQEQSHLEQPRKRANRGNDTATAITTVRCPDGAPAYVQNIISMATEAGMGDRFLQTLILYLRLEDDQGYQGGSLKTVNRPEEIKQWYKRRRAVWYPNIGDLARFGQEFKSWFGACSPAWRVSKGSSLPLVRKNGGDWVCLQVLGANGIGAFLVALIWWKKAISASSLKGSRLEELQSRFDAMFDEVEYTFQSLSVQI